MTPVSGLETLNASSVNVPQTPLVSEATWRVTARVVVSSPAPTSLPSPSTNGIESALKTGPPVTVIEWPVGADESSVTFSVVVLVFGGVQSSAAATSIPKLPEAAFVQVNALDTYGPPSTTALESVNEPAAAGR